MARFIDYLLYLIVVGGIFLFNAFPLSWRLRCARLLLSFYGRLVPSFNEVSRRNIGLVFPQYSVEERNALLERSLDSLARFIVDSFRFHTLNPPWIRAHIQVPFQERYDSLKAQYGGKGVLVVSGHLGSFEFQALGATVAGRSISFVIRNFKHAMLDNWLRKNRERLGAKVIPRKGAVAKIREYIVAGIDVGILIDQNVRREHALFVDWFGRPAATTFAAGLIAVELEPPVVVSAISYIGNGTYRLDECECDLSTVYSSTTMSKEEKILEATRIISFEYQKMILKYPSEWFWMHRRWKTTPDGVAENFYQ